MESKEAIGNSEPSKQGNGLPRPAGDCGERSAGAAETVTGPAVRLLLDLLFDGRRCVGPRGLDLRHGHAGVLAGIMALAAQRRDTRLFLRKIAN